jgi:hypothetical protein
MGTEIYIVRLKTQVRSRSTESDWSPPKEAIIDPGAPYCLFPYSFWSVSEHRILSPHPLPLGGIGGGSVSARFGEIIIALQDRSNYSPLLQVRSLFLEDDSEPLLLGFEGFLTIAILHCDYSQQEAYVEFLS